LGAREGCCGSEEGEQDDGGGEGTRIHIPLCNYFIEQYNIADNVKSM
jgi:hypothetical protein